MNLFNFLKRHWEYSLLILIITLSFLIRWYNVEQFPAGLEGDEVTWTASTLFTQYQLPPSQAGVWFVIEKLTEQFPVSIWLNRVAFFLFGISLTSPRKLLVILSCFSLIFFYFWLKQHVSRKTALIILTLYAFSAYKLITSRIPLQHSFTDLAIFPSFLILEKALQLIKLSSKKLVQVSLFLGLTGMGLVISIFTYNLSYLLPVVVIVYLILRLIPAPLTIRQKLALMFSLGLPLILVLPTVTHSVLGEKAARSYALSNTAFNLDTGQLDFAKLAQNGKTVVAQLFTGIPNSASDMLFKTSATLINPLIQVLFIGGIIGLLKDKKRFAFFGLWLLLSAIPYHIVLGLALSRMWFISYGLLYAVSAIGIELAFKQFTDFPKHQRSLMLVALVFTVIAVGYEVKLFDQEIVRNSSFKPSFREIARLVETHESELGSSVYFYVSQHHDDFSQVTSSFYFLRKHQHQALKISNFSKQAFHIYNLEKPTNPIVIPTGEVLIVENQFVPGLLTQAKQAKLSVISQKTNTYFSEIILVDAKN